MAKTRSAYRRALWARAYDETRRSLGDPWQTVQKVAAVSLAAVVGVLVVFGWEGAVTTAGNVLLSAVVANVLAVSGYLFVHRLRAPFLLYRGAHDALDKAAETITGLEAEVNRKAANQALADALGKLDDWAVHNLWAKHPQSATDPAFPKWQRRITLWKGRVLRRIKNSNCPYLDYRSVKVLGNIGSEPNYHHDSDVNHQMRMLAVRRKRIEALIDKYRTD